MKMFPGLVRPHNAIYKNEFPRRRICGDRPGRGARQPQPAGLLEGGEQLYQDDGISGQLEAPGQ